MTKYTILFDTICTGFNAIHDGEGNPVLYDTIEEAQKEIDDDKEFYGIEECFVGAVDDEFRLCTRSCGDH